MVEQSSSSTNEFRMVKLVLFLALACVLLSKVISLEHEDFILGETEELASTDAGELRVLLGSHEAQPLKEHDVAIARVILEPRALLLPHYKDAALVFYVQRGDAMVGVVCGKTTLKTELRSGDVYSIPAGTVFYVLNTNDTQQLELVGALDTSSSPRQGKLELFFVAGGVDPRTILSGFHPSVLAAAFKVSEDEMSVFLNAQDHGPIIHTSVQVFEGLKSWSQLESVVLDKKGEDEKKHKDDKKHKEDEEKHEKKHKDDKKHKEDEEETKEKHEKQDDEKKHKKDEDERKPKEQVFNLRATKFFESERGWISTTVGENVQALAGARFDICVVKLRAGSLLAPHWNPQGAQFGLITKGSGSIQIAFSDGTSAVDAKVEAGTVFYVPQFFPVCEIAADDEEFEFVVFTVKSPLFSSSTNDRPQFLAGQGSVLQKIDVGILALAFNVPDQLVSGLLNSGQEEYILSSGVSVF